MTTNKCIFLTADAERIQVINQKLLAAQCEIGGCVLYIDDRTLAWETNAGSDNVEFALDRLVALQVFDPVIDMFWISNSAERGDGIAWAEGFAAGFRNGCEFRDASVRPLQTALLEAEHRIATMTQPGPAVDPADIRPYLAKIEVHWNQYAGGAMPVRIAGYNFRSMRMAGRLFGLGASDINRALDYSRKPGDVELRIASTISLQASKNSGPERERRMNLARALVAWVMKLEEAPLTQAKVHAVDAWEGSDSNA